MKKPERYWISSGGGSTSLTIHSAACSWCNDGRGKNKQAEHIADGWYGFYTSCGAAFDAARAMGKVKKAT